MIVNSALSGGNKFAVGAKVRVTGDVKDYTGKTGEVVGYCQAFSGEVARVRIGLGIVNLFNSWLEEVDT